MNPTLISLPGKRFGVISLVIYLLAIFVLTPARARAQTLSPDDAAAQILNAAHRAYNEKNYPVAIERFRTFLQTAPNHRDSLPARYGLALALLDGPTKDPAAASEALQSVLANPNFPDRPFALYYLGLAQRLAGQQELARAESKPAEAPQHLALAQTRFTEAATQFTAAATSLAARIKSAPDTKELPPDLEWSARARCDAAEMLLRTAKPQEAAAHVAPFLKDPLLTRSRYRSLALYHHGYASFLLKNYVAAGRSLVQLAPFDNTDFGLHARFLLARIRHLAGERPEAAAGYDAVLAGFKTLQQATAESLKNPNLPPDERARLQTLASGPAPQFVAHALFYSAVLLYEQSQFTAALTKFDVFIAANPKSPLIDDAQLRRAFCQVQNHQYPEALKTLTLLQSHPRLADQALWWTARAQAATADPKDPAAFRPALDSFRRAADTAAQRAPHDPDAKARRCDILLELADSQQLAKDPRAAAVTYQQILAETPPADRAEQALQRLVTAQHLAGQYQESDAACQRFFTAYPQSSLLAAVRFRFAENAYLPAITAANTPNAPVTPDAQRLLTESTTRLALVISQHPDFTYVNRARYHQGICLFRLGQLDKAAAVLQAVPVDERASDLAGVSYLLADCLIRRLPEKGDDALSSAALVQQCQDAISHLRKFLSAAPASPQAAEALLRQGYCGLRIAMVTALATERQKALASAAESYERILTSYATAPEMPTAVLEKAKCLVLLGDLPNAATLLKRFQNDLKAAPQRSLALVRLSAILRAQNKPAEAVTLLADTRPQDEPALLQDPARRDWVPLLQYEHALALQQSAKLSEAQTLCNALAKQFPTRPEAADAQWRSAQCRRLDTLAKLLPARQVLAQSDPKSDSAKAAATIVDQSLAALRETATTLRTQFAALPPTSTAETRQHFCYETAWCLRLLADVQIQAARQNLQQQAADRLRVRLAKDAPKRLPALRGLEIPLSAVPLQDPEQQARQQYQAMIDLAPTSSLAVTARQELAELLIPHQEFEPAIALLAAALEQDPPPDLADTISLRLAECHLARQHADQARRLCERIAARPQSLNLIPARCLLGEAFVQQENWTAAIEQLQVFRDADPYRNAADLAPRALLLLGQAYAAAGQWDASRQTLENLNSRFPQTPWRDDALYALGWARQQQRQYDAAIASYREVIQRTPAAIAAKAQLQIGLCLAASQRQTQALSELQAVDYTYDYPEWSAAAFCEAGHIALDLKQPEDATRFLERAIQADPKGKWAPIAKQRLAEVRK